VCGSLALASPALLYTIVLFPQKPELFSLEQMCFPRSVHVYGVPGEPMSDIHANNIQHSKKMNVEW
jgi:hypothetical protein